MQVKIWELVWSWNFCNFKTQAQFSANETSCTNLVFLRWIIRWFIGIKDIWISDETYFLWNSFDCQSNSKLSFSLPLFSPHICVFETNLLSQIQLIFLPILKILKTSIMLIKLSIMYTFYIYYYYHQNHLSISIISVTIINSIVPVKLYNKLIIVRLNNIVWSPTLCAAFCEILQLNFGIDESYNLNVPAKGRLLYAQIEVTSLLNLISVSFFFVIFGLNWTWTYSVVCAYTKPEQPHQL